MGVCDCVCTAAEVQNSKIRENEVVW